MPYISISNGKSVGSVRVPGVALAWKATARPSSESVLLEIAITSPTILAARQRLKDLIAERWTPVHTMGRLPLYDAQCGTDPLFSVELDKYWTVIGDDVNAAKLDDALHSLVVSETQLLTLYAEHSNYRIRSAPPTRKPIKEKEAG